MKLLIASRNQNKISEFKTILTGLNYELVTPDDVGIDGGFDVQETGDTFEKNAVLKTKGFADKWVNNEGLVLADDSGLLVDALNGEPGVHSKRYANTNKERMEKVLKKMKSVPRVKRTARFVCCMALYNPETEETKIVEGVVEGLIAMERTGSSGFGYDPIFIPSNGNGETFAELGSEFKNLNSHRSSALKQIRQALETK